jgi:hypothetical protein
MKINSINTTAALALFFIAFAIMLIGVLVAKPAGTVIVQEAQAQQQKQQTRDEALTEATENLPDGPSETLAADDPTQKEGDDIAPNADKELDTVTVCIDVPPSQMTEEVTVGEAQFLEETIPESELSYGAC